MLRTRRALAVQLALVVALAVLVVVRWPADARADLDGASARQVLRVFGYGLMVGLILLAPVFPATSIVKEKVQGTLALLLNSPIRPWAIAGGKLVGMAGFVLLLVTLSIPAAAACFAMGGIDLIEGFGRMYLVLVLLALQYATLALLISSYASTTDSALRITYGIILLLAVVAMGPHRFLRGEPWLSPGMAASIDWIRCISPVPAMFEVLGDTSVGAGGLAAAGSIASRYCVIAAVSSIIFMFWTAMRLNMRVLDRARAAGKVTDDRSTSVKAYRRIMYLWFFDPKRRDGLIGAHYGTIVGAVCGAVVMGAAAAVWFVKFPFGQEGQSFQQNLGIVAVGTIFGFLAVICAGSILWLAVTQNPVTVKEQKCNRFGRSNWLLRLVGACLIISLLLMLAAATRSSATGVSAMGGIMVILQVSLIILLTPSLASGLISGERESRGWQLLQMTPMSTATIVIGKLLSVIVTLVLVLLATLPAYAVLIFIDPGQWQIAVNVLITLTLTAVLALFLSAGVSSLFRQTAAATATSYALLVGLCAGTMLFWLGQDAPFNRDMVEKVLTINPLAAALNLIDAPGFTEYNFVPTTWYIVGGMCGLSLFVLVVQVWRLTRPQ